MNALEILKECVGNGIYTKGLTFDLGSTISTFTAHSNNFINDDKDSYANKPERSQKNLFTSPNIQHRKKIKTFVKVWSEITKFLKSSLSQNIAIHFYQLGKFYPSKNDEYIGSPKYYYIPSLDFIQNAKLEVKHDEYNISPSDSIKGRSCISLSIERIALNCEMDKETVKLIIKEIFHKLSEVAKQRKPIKLNLRIGYLIIENQRIYFRNYESKDVKMKTEGHVAETSPNPINNYRQSFSVTKRRDEISPNESAYYSSGKKLFNMDSSYKRKTSLDDRANRKAFSTFHGVKAPMPFPFLSKMAKDIVAPPKPVSDKIYIGYFAKFGKKMHISLMDDKLTLAEELKKQIERKKKKDHKEFVKTQLAEREAIERITAQIYKEKSLRDTSYQKKINEVVTCNDLQKKLRKEKREKEIENEKNQKEYFPFIHGDKISSQRENNYKRQKEEMNSFLKQNISKPKQLYHRTHHSDKLFLSSRPSQTSAESPYFPISHLSMKKTEEFREQAFKKYEDDLKMLEQKRLKEFESQKSYQQKLEAIERENQERRMKHMNECQNYLKGQISQIREKRKNENLIEKIKYKTHYGPEEAEDEIRKFMHREKKNQMKQDLLSQIAENKKIRLDNLAREKQDDADFIQNVNSTLLRDEAIKRHLNQSNKDMFVRVLNDQIAMKNRKKACMETEI